jgi:hypothetical protein
MSFVAKISIRAYFQNGGQLFNFSQIQSIFSTTKSDKPAKI